MVYQQDWMMRQIEMLLEALLRFLLHGKQAVSDAALRQTLSEKLDAGDICGAEDLLFDHLHPENEAGLAEAVRFYQTLNTRSDAELAAADFSREEIASGIKDVCRIYNVQDTVDFLFEFLP